MWPCSMRCFSSHISDGIRSRHGCDTQRSDAFCLLHHPAPASKAQVCTWTGLRMLSDAASVNPLRAAAMSMFDPTTASHASVTLTLTSGSPALAFQCQNYMRFLSGAMMHIACVSLVVRAVCLLKHVPSMMQGGLKVAYACTDGHEQNHTCKPASDLSATMCAVLQIFSRDCIAS